MKHIFIILFTAVSIQISAQSKSYSVANAHSHNDYEQEFPFWSAYNQDFGSIEVDIFLHNGQLIVAHDLNQLALNRTLDSLYLKSLRYCLVKNNGYVFADSTRQLQLMIDIKSRADSTLHKLVEELRSYPEITTNATIKIVISGNRPEPAKFAIYPAYILFDGELSKDYPVFALERIAMLSDNFKRYSNWNGKQIIPEQDRNNLQTAIHKAHRLNKKVRFWNAPDRMSAWSILIELGVDFINTDKITELGRFFKTVPK